MSGKDETTTNDDMPDPVARDDRADAMALLSDDEREALGLTLGDEAAAQPDDESDDDADDGDDDAPAESDAGSDTEDDAPAAEPEAPADARAADHQTTAMAGYSYTLPDDFDEQRSALEAKYEALEERMQGGDISSAEYSRELRALGREESRLDGMQQRADIAAEMREQAERAAADREGQAWMRAVDLVVKEAKDQAIEGEPDYAGDEKAGLQLGAQVNAIMVARGIEPGAFVSDADKLDMLRQARRELHFRRTGQALPDDSAKVGADERAAAKKEKADARKPKLEGIVPPVSTLPGAGGSGGEEAEFAALIELDGEAFENAMSTLRARDPAKYERFLASS